jgi:hypothetical protein
LTGTCRSGDPLGGLIDTEYQLLGIAAHLIEGRLQFIAEIASQSLEREVVGGTHDHLIAIDADRVIAPKPELNAIASHSFGYC